ncbi:MAG: hypothetical protein ABSH01_06705 [Terriglobia bacterium]
MDNVSKAKKALVAAGLTFTETDVLLQELPNIPGALGSFTGKLAHKGISVDSSWGSTIAASKKATVVLSVSDLASAARVR